MCLKTTQLAKGRLFNTKAVAPVISGYLKFKSNIADIVFQCTNYVLLEDGTDFSFTNNSYNPQGELKYTCLKRIISHQHTVLFSSQTIPMLKLHSMLTLATTGLCMEIHCLAALGFQVFQTKKMNYLVKFLTESLILMG